jgi:hypothetical protein
MFDSRPTAALTFSQQAKQFDRGARDLVGALFDRLDVVGAAQHVVAGGHQRGQFAAAFDDLLGVFVEQIEKAAFLRHQPSKHCILPGTLRPPDGRTRF